MAGMVIIIQGMAITANVIATKVVPLVIVMAEAMATTRGSFILDIFSRGISITRDTFTILATFITHTTGIGIGDNQ